jgi:hypothetical protein
VFGQLAKLFCRQAVGLAQKFRDRGWTPLDNLKKVVRHAAGQGDHFVRVFTEKLGHSLDAFRCGRVDILLSPPGTNTLG